MNLSKRTKTFALVGVVLIVAALLFGILRPRPIKVALVNFPQFMVARAISSADEKNTIVQVEDDLSQLRHYDFVLAFGMGLKWSPQDREVIQKLVDERKCHMQVIMATSPDNDISSLSEEQSQLIAAYFGNGGAKNYRSGFNYIRQDILGKSLRVGSVEKPIEFGENIFFGKSDDDLFSSLKEYESYYKGKGYKEGAPRVAMLISFASPTNSNREHIDEIVASLEESGLNVYPFSAGADRLEILRAINPDLVIYMPHGKMLSGNTDPAINYLKQQNVPIIAPLTIVAETQDWFADKQGMVGGFLSQSVSTPEIDGAMVPYALVALERDRKTGLEYFHAIPDRLKSFTRLINNYILLKRKPNSEKRVAIYYFKGPGQNSLVAQGIEVLPSLYNVLLRLQKEGYNVSGLPETEAAFEQLVMTRGALFNSYAEAAIAEFIAKGYPQFVSTDSLTNWMNDVLTPSQIDSLSKRYGPAPGQFYTMQQGGRRGIAVTAIPFGNVVLIPQPGQGVGENDFKAVHGANPIPPYPYVASYLWMQKGFRADVVIHFGTHGSLEFINGKQIALSREDWTDRMINDRPHIYYYTIANIGEGMIAKRRSYGGTVSYLAPPFIETRLNGEVADLLKLTDQYLADEMDDQVLSLQIKALTVRKGFSRDLRLDSVCTKPYSRQEIEQISDFAEELAVSKIPGGMYRTGIPFSSEKVHSSVLHIATDPIAYALAALDRHRGKYTQTQQDSERFFSQNYRLPAERVVRQVLASRQVNTEAILTSLGVTPQELAQADKLIAQSEANSMAMMEAMKSSGSSGMGMALGAMKGKKSDMMPGKSKSGKASHPSKKANGISPKRGGRMPAAMMEAMKSTQQESLSPQEKTFVASVQQLRHSINAIVGYYDKLIQSPEQELTAIVNALNGGYLAPSPGGDYIANSETLPTGRNLYSINAETTPTLMAWKKGKKMAEDLLDDYRKRHNGELPQKVSFSLWSSSFIESEGATIAEIIYLLGCEPVRDMMGRVQDVKLIPKEELKRKRVDVVVQTSGQLRDLAASRLYLIQKAVDLAAQETGEKDNEVAKGAVDAERVLLEKGLSPKEARSLSTQRVFGGINGNYGTGIQEMVESGDRWEKESEIADVYLNNMGAIYGSGEHWGDFEAGLFEAALQNVDAVVQPRQSNSWGPLSLDHVYEFMGGLTLAVRQVTGKDPEGYFNDLRNHHRTRVQEMKQAIGVEARTTILNPTYIKEVTKEGQGAASALAETIRNTYGWNVMKPSVIDNELWDDLYNTYVKDDKNLGIRAFFEQNNPAALQEITAVMMETIRKGMWKASSEQRKTIAELHAQEVEKFGAGCSSFVCDNAKLRDHIAKELPNEQQKKYEEAIQKVRNLSNAQSKDAQRLKKDELTHENSSVIDQPSKLFLPLSIGVVVLLVIVFIIYRKRKSSQRKDE